MANNTSTKTDERQAKVVLGKGLPTVILTPAEPTRYVFKEGSSAHLRLTADFEASTLVKQYVGADGKDVAEDANAQRVSAYLGSLRKAASAGEKVNISETKPAPSREGGISVDFS
jgi:hypothetical protein